MNGGLTSKHAEAYRRVVEIRQRSKNPNASSITLPAELWDTLRDAELVERRALRMHPLAEGELRLRGSYWHGIKLLRAKR